MIAHEAQPTSPADDIAALPAPPRHCRYTVGLYSAKHRAILVLHDDSVDSATLEDVIFNTGRALQQLTPAAERNPDQDARYQRATTRAMLQPITMACYIAAAFLIGIVVNIVVEILMHQQALPWHAYMTRAIPGVIITALGYGTFMWGAANIAAYRAMRALARYQPQPDDPFRRELGTERRVLHVVRFANDGNGTPEQREPRQ